MSAIFAVERLDALFVHIADKLASSTQNLCISAGQNLRRRDVQLRVARLLRFRA